jgi:hypothetical protein
LARLVVSANQKATRVPSGETAGSSIRTLPMFSRRTSSPRTVTTKSPARPASSTHRVTNWFWSARFHETWPMVAHPGGRLLNSMRSPDPSAATVRSRLAVRSM